MQTITFSKVLDTVEQLPQDQQEKLIDIIHRRLVEARRQEIARNAQETLKAYRSGKAKQGSVRDLRKTLAK